MQGKCLQKGDTLIYKRGKTYWFQFQVNGKRFRESAKTTNRAEALRREAARRTAAIDGHLGREKRGFSEAFDDFLLWTAAHVKPRTHKRYSVSGKRLKAHFATKRLLELSTQDVERFKNERSSECSNAGVNRDLACLRTFRNWCLRMGFAFGQCVFKLLPESSGNMRIVSHEEERTYTEHADPVLGNVATVMVETGMRPGEVFSMQGEHVNLDGKSVFIPTGKTRFARRTIPLTDRAYRLLGRLWRPGLLFQGKVPHQMVMRSHKALCKRLGFDFRLYDFRHTYCSRMAMAGVDLMTLKELAGHSSITITQRYCHPDAEHKKVAIQKLEQYNHAKEAKQERRIQ
jgi:integrase